MGRSPSLLSRKSETSVTFTGRRAAEPWKITSSILPPRKSRADCSPRTQRTESETLDLPQPFGPTIAVTPSSKVSVTVSAKDLKPESSSLVSFMPSVSLGRWVKLLGLGLVLGRDDEGRHADCATRRLRLLARRIRTEYNAVHV